MYSIQSLKRSLRAMASAGTVALYSPERVSVRKPAKAAGRGMKSSQTGHQR